MKSASSSASSTIRIMLVNDHQLVLWGLRTLIDSEAPRMQVVETASNAGDALAKASSVLPDIIVLDLHLNGGQSREILPSLVANGHSRVLLLTGTHDQEAEDNAILNGARGILHKDVPAEQLLKAIKKTYEGELWVDKGTLGRVFGKIINPARTVKIDPEAQRQASLTVKERKIIQTMVDQGGTVNKTLAQLLFISEHTLRNHLTSIYQKLEVGNRLELYVYAVKHGLGKPHGVDSVANDHPRATRPSSALPCVAQEHSPTSPTPIRPAGPFGRTRGFFG